MGFQLHRKRARGCSLVSCVLVVRSALLCIDGKPVSIQSCTALFQLQSRESVSRDLSDKTRVKEDIIDRE